MEPEAQLYQVPRNPGPSADSRPTEGTSRESGETSGLCDSLQEHYEDPYHRGECPSPTHALEVNSERFGGLQLSLRLTDGLIGEAWFDGEADPAAEALTSLLCQAIEARDASRLTAIATEDFLRLLELPESAVSVEIGDWVCGLLRSTLSAPLDADDDVTFQGPHLGEEC